MTKACLGQHLEFKRKTITLRMDAVLGALDQARATFIITPHCGPSRASDTKTTLKEKKRAA